MQNKLVILYPMKKTIVTMLFSVLALSTMFAQNVSFGNLPVSDAARKWYKAGKWKNGFKPKPYEEMDIETFYQQYQKHPAMYDSIFTWLANVDGINAAPGNEVVKWSHAWANIQDLDTRTPEALQWEQHRKRIDIQWDLTGCERYGLTRSPEILTPTNEYSDKKDVQNFVVKKAPTAEQYRVLDSNPKKFFIFFPKDVHEACGTGKQPERVRKIVVKIDYFE